MESHRGRMLVIEEMREERGCWWLIGNVKDGEDGKIGKRRKKMMGMGSVKERGRVMVVKVRRGEMKDAGGGGGSEEE